MKITCRRHSVIEQQIEISKLSLHLQERIYDFLNNDKFISKGDDMISLLDMRDLPGTINATIDTHGNINCLGCTNCKDCTECLCCTNCSNCEECSFCKDCEDCKKCKDCVRCCSCEDCEKCFECENSRECKR